MKFCWTTIMVCDMEESLKFYQEIVGLSLERRLEAGPGRAIAFLGDGETKIELIYDANAKKGDIGESISLGFVVNSVDEMMEFVSDSRLEIHGGPYSPNPHVKFFYVKDPNGLKIQFVENIE